MTGWRRRRVHRKSRSYTMTMTMPERALAEAETQPMFLLACGINGAHLAENATLFGGC